MATFLTAALTTEVFKRFHVDFTKSITKDKRAPLLTCLRFGGHQAELREEHGSFTCERNNSTGFRVRYSWQQSLVLPFITCMTSDNSQTSPIISLFWLLYLKNEGNGNHYLKDCWRNKLRMEPGSWWVTYSIAAVIIIGDFYHHPPWVPTSLA